MVPKRARFKELLAGLGGRPWTWWCTLTIVTVGGLTLWAHTRFYAPFFTDDGFISLRYTQRLLEGRGLTWNDGERVEGYSNLLWVLLTAIPGILRIDLVDGARAVGFGCMLATFAAFVQAARPRRVSDGLAPLLGVLLLAATNSIAVWSVGGLEPPLVIALLAWGVVAATRAVETSERRWLVAASLCFGFLCWTRPDAPLWAAGAVPALLVGYRRAAFRVALMITAVVAVFVACQLAFRVAYYDDYLPNTAYAKVALSSERLAKGRAYLVDSLMPLAATWTALTLSIAQAASRKHLRPKAVLLLALTVLWTAYVVRVGGDIFPAWRHWPYLVTLGGLGLTLVTRDDLEDGRWSASLRWGLTLVVLAIVGAFFDPGNWAKQERWQWDGVPVGKVLKRAFEKERPRVAVDAAGSIPFYSGLPALDMLGLTDRYLAHHRPKNMGASLLGHELGDADYYLKREPDIFCFGVPPCFHGAKFPAQLQMVRKRAFTESYLPVRLEARVGRAPLVSEVWIRRSGRIGVVQEPNAVTVPAHLLATNPGVLAVKPRRDKTGFDARFSPNSSSSIDRLVLAPGTWTLTALSPDGSARVRATSRGRELTAGSADAPLELTLDEPTSVTLLVHAGRTGFSTHGLSLRKK